MPGALLTAPAGPAHQEALDKLWYLREFVALGAVLLPESFRKHDGRQEEAGFQDVVLSVQSRGRSAGGPLSLPLPRTA